MQRTQYAVKVVEEVVHLFAAIAGQLQHPIVGFDNDALFHLQLLLLGRHPLTVLLAEASNVFEVDLVFLVGFDVLPHQLHSLERDIYELFMRLDATLGVLGHYVALLKIL